MEKGNNLAEASLEEILTEMETKNKLIDQQVQDMKGSMKDYEWFAYMGYAERRKDVNLLEAELKLLSIKKAISEKQINMGWGDCKSAQEELDAIDLALLSKPILLERAKLRVQSSYEYYKMTADKISRMDYETWILGNRKVPLGDDENYVKCVKSQYKDLNSENDESIQSTFRM